MRQKNPSVQRMTEIIELLRKEDRLTLLIKFESTPEQAIADIFEDYLSLMEECDSLRGEVDRQRYQMEDQQSTISRLEEEANQAHRAQGYRIDDLESQVYRMERDNRNLKCGRRI